MENIELRRHIPVSVRADVAVVGGGPSGFAAAVASARTGAATVLIEEYGCAGGMATMGLVGPFMTSYDKDGKIMVIRGLFEELVERLVRRGGAIHPSQVRAGTAFTSWIVAGHDHVTPFEPEQLKLVMDEMLAEAGVRVLYHTRFVEPVMGPEGPARIVVDSKAGLEAVEAAVFIDCTGDGDLAARCGVPFDLGDPASHITQPASMFFRIGNVDLEAVEADIQANRENFYRKDGVNYRSFHWRVAEARAKGDWTLNRVSIGLFRGVKPDEWSVNTSRLMDVDATDNRSLTEGEIQGRKQAEEIFRFLRKYVPGCQDARLLSVASTVGIRESRHIHGRYTLTKDDVLDGRVPEDAILLAANSIDVHGRFGPLSNEYLTMRHGRWYGVPYRCLLPKGAERLLIAGRCVSATAEAAGAIRVMPPCVGTGQAAGTAAALSIRQGCPPSALDPGLLRRALREQGVFLDQD